MANEINIGSPSGATLYAIIRRESDSKVWNGTTFVTWDNAGITGYDIPLTDEGGDYYAGDFPTTIGAGNYFISYYLQAGGTPAITDFKLPADEALYWTGTSVAEPPADDVEVFGTREGIEQKIGVVNLETYANLENDDADAEPGITNIAAAIDDDLIEAATDMHTAWREFTAVALDSSNAIEARWLADTNEYGAAVKAWNGRNIDRASSEDVPQQIATALDEWTRRLEMLRTGTALLDYQDAEEIIEEDNWPAVDEPVSAVATVDRDGRTISTTGVGPYWDGNLPGYRW